MALTPINNGDSGLNARNKINSAFSQSDSNKNDIISVSQSTILSGSVDGETLILQKANGATFAVSGSILGPTGADGTIGVDGATGATGPQGPTGPQGSFLGTDFEGYLSSATAISLLTDNNNWSIGGTYTGATAISDTFQGQIYYENGYSYQAIDDNDWTRWQTGEDLYVENYNTKVTNVSSVTGSYALNISSGNFYKLTLTGDTTFDVTNPQVSSYTFLIEAGANSFTLGTSSNFKTTGATAYGFTGSAVMSAVYDGTDMWISAIDSFGSL